MASNLASEDAVARIAAKAWGGAGAASAAPARPLSAAPVGGSDDAVARIAAKAWGSTKPSPAPATPPGTNPNQKDGWFVGGIKRGSKSLVASVEGTYDPVSAAARADKDAKADPGLYPSFEDAKGAVQTVQSLAETAAESLPAFGATLVASAGAVMSGGTLPAAMLAAGAVSGGLTFGGIKVEQQQKFGKVDNTRAAIGAGVSAALDSFVPGKVGTKALGPVKAQLAEAIYKRVLKEGAKGGLGEGATESAQTIIEEIAVDPDAVRILTNPKTAADRAAQRSLLYRVAEGGIVGTGVGGAAGGAAGGVQAARQKQAAKTASTYQYAGEPDSGVDEYLRRLRLVESSASNPRADKADNPNSSAYGRFQFIDSTWLQYVRRERPDLARGRSDAQVLAMKSNGRLQEQMVRAFTNDNAKALSAAGLPVTNATLGTMHRFGIGGGVKVLKAAAANPETRIADVVSAGVMEANPDLKKASLDTVGEVVNFYEQRLGLGSSYRADAGMHTRIGAADVRTRKDRSGGEIAEQAVADAANAASDLFAARLEAMFNASADKAFEADVAAAEEAGDPTPERDAGRDALPESARQKLALELEKAPDSAQGFAGGRKVIARIMEIADGLSTPSLPTVQAAQLQQAAVQVLDDLGYTKGERTAGDFSPAQELSSFRSAQAAPTGDPDAKTPPRWKLANAMRVAFSLQDQTPNLGRITTDSGGRVIAQSLRALAYKQGEAATAARNKASNKKGGDRRVATKAAQAMQKAKTAFERGAAAFEYLALSPSERLKTAGFADPSEARTAVLNMFQTTQGVAQSRVLARTLSEFTPLMTQERTGRGGKGYYTFFKALERIANDAGATDPATREAVRVMFKTSDERAKTLKDELAGNRKVRTTGIEAERDRRNEERAKEVEAWTNSIKNISDSQILNAVGRLEQSVPMMLDLLQGNTKKMTGYAPKLRDPGKLYDSLMATGALPVGLDLLPMTTVDSEVGRKLFFAFTLHGRRTSFTQHVMRIANSVQGKTRSHVAETERVARILTDSVAKEKNPRESERRLTSIMHFATHHRLSGAGITADGGYQSLTPFLLAMEKGGYDEAMQARDPNGRHANRASDGTWSYYSHVAGKIAFLAESLDAVPRAQQNAYVRVRRFFRDSANNILLTAINNTRREMGLSVVQTLENHDKVESALLEMFEGDPSLTQETRATLAGLVRASLEGDYFPLQRNGDYSVFARQTFVWKAETMEGAIAQANEARKNDPFMQNFDREGTPKATRNNETGLWEVKTEISYYSQFASEAEADAARAALISGKGKLDDLPDEIKTQREQAPNFRPTEVSPALRVGSDVERSHIGGLTDGQAAALLGSARNDPDLKNTLIELLPDRRMASSLKVRQDVLGGPPLMSEIIRVREPSVGATLGRLSGAQDMRDVFAKAREHQERTVKQAAAASSDAERKRLEKRANGQALLVDYIEKRATEQIDVFGFIAPINDFMARMMTVWFLAGTSNAMMNATQVFVYGIPEFASRYGPNAARRLIQTQMWALAKTTKDFLRGRVRNGVVSGTTRDGLDYLIDGQEIDARHFYTRGADDTSRINTSGEMKALTWEQVAGQPKGASFEVDQFGASKVFLLSQSEFESYQRGRFSAAQIVAISNARKGGHLSATFTEEARVTRLRKMNAGQRVFREAASVADKMFDVATLLPATVEYANRLSVVLATLAEETRKLETAGHTGELGDTLFAEVERNANVMNDRINISYSTINRTVVQRKAGFLLQFTTFPLAIMLKLWGLTVSMVSPSANEGGYTRKQAATVSALSFLTIGLFAGGKGAVPWFINFLLESGLSALAWMFDDDEEDDNDILDKQSKYGSAFAIEATLRESSDLVADLWSKGPVSMATGLALQDRMGVHQFPIRIDTGLEFNRNSIGGMMASLLGPVGAVAAGGADVWADYKYTGELDGRLARAMLPKFARDFGMATEVAKGGGATDKRGAEFMNNEALKAEHAAVSMALGFTPQKLADANKGRLIQAKRNMEDKGRRAAVNKAFRDGDTDRMFDQLVAQRTAFPDRAMTTKSIMDNYKSRAKEEAARTLVFDGLSPETPLESMEIAEGLGLEK